MEPTVCQRVLASELTCFVETVMRKAGVAEVDARNVADSLVTANLRGIDSHGITRLPSYLERHRRGLIASATRLEVVEESGVVLVLDAHNGWGATAGLRAMQLVMERAQTQGLAAAVVRHSNHFGIAAHYALPAVERGMIGLALTNTSPSISPWGGREAYLGTNPICLAVPSDDRWPLVYDGATSQVARGKLQMAMQKGASIPLTWALDATGEATDDPCRGLDGSLLPLGGYKGSGLALMVEVLTGVLAGTAFGAQVGQLVKPTAAQDVAHFFAALRVDAFMPLVDFRRRMGVLSAQVRALPRRPGMGEVLLPGEPEFREEERRCGEGIPITPDVWSQLTALSLAYEVALPAIRG